MNTNDRNRINQLKADRAVLLQRTLALRAKQIELDGHRAQLAVRIAENDEHSNGMDQEIATIIAADYKSRVTETSQ